MYSSLKVFQIGDVRVDVKTSNSITEYDTKSRAKAEELMYSSYRVSAEDVYAGDTPSIKIQGFVMSSYNKLMSQQIQELRSLVGRTTFAISYFLLNANDQVICCDCLSQGGCKAVWIEAPVNVKSVDFKQRNIDDIAEFTINIEVLDNWKGLNPVTWTWKGGGYNSLDVFDVPANWDIGTDIDRKYFPNCEEIFHRGCKECGHWQFRQYNDFENQIYDPDYFAIRHRGFAGHIKTGEGSDWTTVNNWREVQSDPFIWGAPPSSIYALTNLPNSGNIVGNVVFSEGLFKGTTTTTLDLAELNTLLSGAGYSGLLSTDILFFGDLRRRSGGILYTPSFVERSGSVLPVHPPISYEGNQPVQLGVGTSRWQIAAPNSNVSLAYVHTYKRM